MECRAKIHARLSRRVAGASGHASVTPILGQSKNREAMMRRRTTLQSKEDNTTITWVQL